MTVYDQWHLSFPKPGKDRPCEHKRGKTQLYPSAAHGKGKRYQVRWRDEAGEPQKRNFDKKTGADPDTCAEAFDAEVTTTLNAGTYVDPSAGRITLDSYAKGWRAGLTSDPASQEAVDRHLAHIASLGNRQMRPLAKSPSAVQQWVKGLETKGLAPGYIKSIAGTLSAIFNAAIDDGVVVRNPVRARSVKLPPRPKRLAVPWTEEMVAAAAAELGRQRDAEAMVWLGAGAGLRLGEVFAFAEEDVQFLGRDRKILVRRQIKRIGSQLIFALPKEEKARELPLSDEMAAWLAAQIKVCPPVAVTLPWRRPDGDPHTAKLLFVRASGEAWYRQTFRESWVKARTASGAPDGEDGKFHNLRHTFASACLAGGVDIRTLADWLGHTDPGFTLRTYTHLMPDAAEKGRRAMDAFARRVRNAGQSALDVPSEGDGRS